MEIYSDRAGGVSRGHSHPNRDQGLTVRRGEWAAELMSDKRLNNQLDLAFRTDGGVKPQGLSRR
ncbi:MAG: hypothetical protein OEY91_11845 [Nitrospirota bacterium]|nr:hypothetical protein [Nitrospirota bacterium]